MHSLTGRSNIAELHQRYKLEGKSLNSMIANIFASTFIQSLCMHVSCPLSTALSTNRANLTIILPL